jgi:RNA polymerase sigma factor (sigma-70 family)
MEAYEEIVRGHQATAFRVAYAICGSREDAEEATQDAFVNAYRALGRFRRGAPFRPWLLRIVGNEARTRGRARGRRGALVQRLVEELPSGEAAPSPEGSVLAAAERRRLLEAVAGLPPKQRDAVACVYLLELSEAEAAGALGCRPGTVKSRLSRARARLAAELGEDEGDV